MGDGVAGAGADAQHGARGEVQVLDPALAGEQRGRMARAGVGEVARGQVEHGVQDGGEVIGQQQADGGVRAPQDVLGLGVLHGIGTKEAADLAHDGRGANAVADHVPDGQGDPVAAQREHVIPVAADVHPAGGGQVPHGQVEPVDGGEGTREQGMLEGLGDGVLAGERLDVRPPGGSAGG